MEREGQRGRDQALSTHAQHRFVGLLRTMHTKISLLPPGLEAASGARGGKRSCSSSRSSCRTSRRTTKYWLVGFAGSVALICVLYVITWCVARPADGLRWAALAVVVLAIGLAAWCIPRLVRLAENIDVVEEKYDEASESSKSRDYEREDPEALGLGRV